MNDDELILRRKKQNADRARAYRKRKKDLDAMPSTSTVRSGEPVSENIVTAKHLHQKQLNAERCRRYRQKCKRLKTGANINQGTSDSNTSTSRDPSSSRDLIVNPEEFHNSSDHPRQLFNHESWPQADQRSMRFFLDTLKKSNGCSDVNEPLRIKVEKITDGDDIYSSQNAFEREDANLTQLDVYDEFALAIAKKIKKINDISRRIQLMNTIQNLVENFSATNAQVADKISNAALNISGASQQTVFVPIIGGMQMMQQGMLQSKPVKTGQSLRGLLQPMASQTEPSDRLSMKQLDSVVGQPGHSRTQPNPPYKNYICVEPLTSELTPNESQKHKTKKTLTKKRKMTEKPDDVKKSENVWEVEVPLETTLPTEFVSLGIETDGAATDPTAAPLIDILEIKEERIEEMETSSTSAPTATTESTTASDAVVKFVNDPIPIKLEVNDDTDYVQ